MLLICGLREVGVGIDTQAYVEKYIYNHNDYTSEPLFDWTYSFVRYIGGSGQLWLFGVSLLLYIPYMVALYKFTPTPVLAAFIFLTSPSLFFFDSMNGIRQWIAGGLILLSFVYRSENKYMHSAILFLCAIGFHLSSIIVLPFMFVWKSKIPKAIVVISLLSVTVICLLLSHLDFSSVFEQYIILLDYLNIDNESKLADYARYGVLENTTNWKYFVVNILPISLMCYACYPSDENKYKNYDSYCYLYNTFFIGTILMNVCAVSIMYGHRLFYAIITLQLLLVSQQYVYGTKIQRKYIKALVYFLSIWYLYYIYSTNGSRIGSTVPYSFCF
jgi:hypothetical protein